MTYIPDLSDYDYLPRFARRGTKAVGWLDAGNQFRKDTVNSAFLDCLWEFCKTSVASTRGVHLCPFCQNHNGIECEKNGETLLLGTAEIRVFSEQGEIFAAPTLIYHYVAVHHYLPPEAFVNAVLQGPRPQSQRYFELLESLDLEFGNTSFGGHPLVNPG